MLPKLRIVFMGTPDFAVPPLLALREAGHDVCAVYCQPPRAAGRGRQLRPQPVQQAAEAGGGAVHTPLTLRDAVAQQTLTDLKPDVIVVAAYGLILPPPVLVVPRLGCINIHASLLPRWRGAAPIQRAILAGDEQTGITIMRMAAGLDTGAILLQCATPILKTEDAGALHERLSYMGAEMIVTAMDGLAAGTLEDTAQPEDGVTYAAKLTRNDELIDWSRPASQLALQTRALSPLPLAAFTLDDGTIIKVLQATEVLRTADTKDAPAGMLLDNQFTVACGENTALRLLLTRRAGRAACAAADLLRGLRLPIGQRLP